MYSGMERQVVATVRLPVLEKEKSVWLVQIKKELDFLGAFHFMNIR